MCSRRLRWTWAAAAFHLGLESAHGFLSSKLVSGPRALQKTQIVQRLQPLCAETKEEWWKPRPEWRDDDALEGKGPQDVSELPDSFDDALDLAVGCARQAFDGGITRVRVDFDTTAGDLTYTTLKNSMPLALAFAKYLGGMVFEEDKLERNEEDRITGYSGKKLAVFFPDTGASVWAEQDWRTGRGGARLPRSVRFAAFPNDRIEENDAAVLIVCPRASESEATVRLLESIPPEAYAVVVNPELIDAGVVGYGMAGRRIRDEVEKKLERVYYLKTLSWGALTRRWPKGYSIWLEDEASEVGYTHIKTVGRFPSMDELEDIRMEGDPNTEGQGSGVLDGLAKFIDGLTKM